MSTLVNILRAVHCRSTHHYFAIDALDRLQTPDGRRLASVLLANFQEYLVGAKAPDTKFKDFHNHVIHVSDNQWGGAPQACELWLARAIEFMHESDWKSAAFALGVLSHYFTDPLMPLHTGQHPSEAVVHRPLEWSVCKAYDSILRKCTNHVSFPLDSGPHWISKAVLAGATIAHRHYQPLIEYYDLKQGVADPPKGLDSRSRALLAELFDYALTGWARILERVAASALIEIPIHSLNMPTLMAAVDVPVAWVVSRLTDVAEQRAVAAIFAEFTATGQVVRHVSPEIRAVARAKPFSGPTGPKPVTGPVRKFEALPKPPPVQVPAPVHVPAPVPMLWPVPAPAPPITASAVNETTQAMSATAARPAGSVTLDSDIVDAPSIGPKTAVRFYQIGINTIGQFLAATSAAMSAVLDERWVDQQTLIDWQDQARLVVQVPALCGYKSQLLVGVNCRSATQLASLEIDGLHASIRDYSASDDGARILRNAAVPSRDEVAKWIHSAVCHTTVSKVETSSGFSGNQLP